MNLLEAFQIISRSRNEPGKPFWLMLICGFMPLHLQTFLAAQVDRLNSVPAVLDHVAANAALPEEPHAS